MNKTREEMKALAVKAMKEMGVYAPFIKDFEETDAVTMYIAGLGYTIDKNTEDDLQTVIKKVEEEYNVLVYAVSKNIIGGDTVYALMCVGEKDTARSVLSKSTRDGMAIYELFAYCYNASCDVFSEFGYIWVQNRYGGLRRIG